MVKRGPSKCLDHSLIRVLHRRGTGIGESVIIWRGVLTSLEMVENDFVDGVGYENVGLMDCRNGILVSCWAREIVVVQKWGPCKCRGYNY